MAKKRKPASRPPTPSTRPGSTGRRVQLLVLAAAAVVGVLAAAGVVWLQSRGESGAAIAPAVGDDDPGPVHVHGLGVDPADGSLYIATHTGLWRARAGETRAERVGESRQDTMGFTVVAAGHFAGSGHPDNAQQPPLLGLIESRDAGETWSPVSLSGEADFHVLRFGRTRLYGYDASNDRLLLSADGGRRWTQLERPAPIVDLSVAPNDDRHVLATTIEGMFESANGGRSWRRVSDAVALLAWPRPRRLFLVDAAGAVHVSSDGGRRSTRRGVVGGEPAAVLAGSAEELYVALHDGTVKRSRDGGATWEVRSAP